MSSERIDKTERLLNLTLALLATKRPLTKNEIFAQIPGYSGSAESMERMFERDKDELRELGVVVEVLPTDAYFEDELGYQIIPRDYFLPDVSFSFEESIWLTIATNLLNEFSPQENASQSLQKLLTFSEASVNEIIQAGNSSLSQIPFNENLRNIWRGIRDKNVLRFTYANPTGLSERAVSPIILTSRIGNWYLVAKDALDDQVKTFRTDRMSEITLDRHSPYEEVHESFDLEDFLQLFKGNLIESLKLRLHRALSMEHPLLSRASSLSGETTSPAGSTVILENLDRDHALEMILWAGDAVEILEPVELRHEIVEILERIIEVNS